ncbi:MAG: glycosyltransferase family 39 protein [Acidimicrobiales bacterium]
MRHGLSVSKRWWLWVGVWTAAGLGIRLATVFGRPHSTAKGDAYFYHYAALLLVSGHGAIDPYRYFSHHPHQVIQSASFPPLFVWVVAIPAVFGLKSFFAERIWCCIIGAAAIVVGAMAGREIGGRRVGLIAAFLLAVYPNIWMSDELAMSEALAPLLIAAVLLFAYRFWKQPTVRSALWVGVALGLTMLGRDELSLLVVFLLVPLVLLVRTLSWRRRFCLLGAALGMIVLVIGPWVGYNLSRFKDPVFISTGLGVTMSSADCNTTFSGRFEGYWSAPCAIHTAKVLHVSNLTDESVQDAAFEHNAEEYLLHHEDRLIPVTLAKLGRGFAFFHPMYQLELDAFLETRPYHWAEVGLGMYYAMCVLSIGGTVLLRRRKVPSFPLWAVGLNVAIAMAITFGDPRYRTTFEVCLVLLSSVSLEWIWRKLGRAQTDPADAPALPAPPPAPVPVSAGIG